MRKIWTAIYMMTGVSSYVDCHLGLFSYCPSYDLRVWY